MTGRDYCLLVLAMGAVTYLPRLLPLALLSGRQLPCWFAEWLELIPAAILAALLWPTLFTTGTPPTLVLGKAQLLAAMPTLLVAVSSRSLAGTVLTGMASYWLLGRLL
jgi:branched-subunit amino acid transport protein